jgi:hypothetical protein
LDKNALDSNFDVLSVWKLTTALPRIPDEMFAQLEEANILVLVDNNGTEP